MKAKSASGARVKSPAVEIRTIPSSVTAPAGELMDMEEVIAMLRTTRPTFYRWLRAGRLKGAKIGRQWRFRREDVERFIKGQEPEIDLTADITPLLDTLRKRLKGDGVGEKESHESELVRAVKLMIHLAAQMRASDIHIEPQPKDVAILRYRLDGVLQPIAELDIRLLPAIVKQWKILAACNVHETSRPQEGRILMKYSVAGEELDLRVTFLPAVLGETLSAVLLDPKTARISLEQMDYAEADRKKIQHWLGSPWGTVVFTGPTGCGKTSALYACLNQITAGPVRPKVMTVEDPVEYLLPGTTQVPVRTVADMTFGSVLRAVLRSNPDVIMVGEIRDLETLTLSLQAAMTGHRVLISLHTSEAVTALQRMIDVGVNSFTVADATRLIIAQRLVRLLCPKCSVARKPAEPFLTPARKLARLGGLPWDALPGGFREPVGCKGCNLIGFQGRTVIAEALEVTPRVAAALTRGATIMDLRAIAVNEGMTTLACDGIRRAAQGKTSLAEVMKTISPIYTAELAGSAE
jgi:excisionase family DNA binding protein